VLLAGALDHFSFEEIIGSYLVSGIVILGLGMTGWIKKIMDYIPLPIVMSMVAGIFLPLALNIIEAFGEVGWIAFATLMGYVLLSVVPRLGRICPPIIGAMAVGVVTTIVMKKYELAEPITLSFVKPTIYIPHFSFQSMMELVIPLVITVIGIHNTQGIGVLKSYSYNPPSNVLTVTSGIGSLIMGVFGSILYMYWRTSMCNSK
jgi:benzoate membrane transport protein